MSINVTNPHSSVKSNPALTALLNEVIQRVADHLQSEIIPADDDDVPVATDGAAPQPQEVA